MSKKLSLRKKSKWEIIPDDIPMAQEGIRVQNLSPLEKDSLDLYNYTLLQKRNEGYKSPNKKNNSGFNYFLSKIFGGDELNKGWLSDNKFDNNKQQSLEILKDKNLEKNRLTDEEDIYNKHGYNHNKTLPEVRSSNKTLWERADSLVKNNPNIAFINYSNSPDIQHRSIEPIGMYYGIAGNYEFPKPSFYGNLEKPVMVDSPSNPPANGVGFKRQISQIPKPKEKITPPDTLKVPQYTKIVDGKRIAISEEEYNKRTKGQEAIPTGFKLDSQGKVLQFKQSGGFIKTDPQGYWNKENHGKPVRIPSNEITMKGVNQNLLGISDTGDIQMMFPGMEYSFDGSSVTEFPIMQQGGQVRQPIRGTKEQYQAYQDSLNLYNISLEQANLARSMEKQYSMGAFNGETIRNNYNKQITPAFDRLTKYNKKPPSDRFPFMEKLTFHDELEYQPWTFKKPVQPIEVEEEFKPIQPRQLEQIQTQPINRELNKIPFSNYFSRQRQSQEQSTKGKKDYFDKKSGKLLGTYKSGGSVSSDWVIIQD